MVTGRTARRRPPRWSATVLGQRYRVLTNDTGSNFVRGAITATVEHASWAGRLPFDVAVFELDEAWAVRFVERVAPRHCLLLNVMRDQLDRFGEIDTTARLLGAVGGRHHRAGRAQPRRHPGRRAGRRHRRPGQLLRRQRASCGELFPNDEELYGGPVARVRPARHRRAAAPARRRPARAHHGPARRRAQPAAAGRGPAQRAERLRRSGARAGARPRRGHRRRRAAEVRPAFGRGQAFDVDGRQVVLQLVKNPAGFRQSLRTARHRAAGAIVIAINDDYADGRDVSWLWDVDFAALGAPRVLGQAVDLRRPGGRHGGAAALRRRRGRRASSPTSRRRCARRCAAADPAERVIVFSTYTAMWALHAVLAAHR